jgi:threonine synthase
MMRVQCCECGNAEEFTLESWRCNCGGAWEVEKQSTFIPHKIRSNDYTIWRYGDQFGLDIQVPSISMGVGWTPLIPIQLLDKQVFLKMEYLMPTGSFKDRGVNTMVNQLAHMGVELMVEDSSGNAGASLAAHGACFGIHTKIFIPGYASPFKKHQISIYGVEVTRINGSRRDTEIAAQSAVGPKSTYASHAFQPAYLAGQSSVAWEVWEQLGQKAPDWIICRVAQGGQFLGFFFGFLRLLAAGLINHLPRLVAVQSAQIAPLYHAWHAGLDTVPAIVPLGPTVAEGVSISNPVRGKRLLQAIRESCGLVLQISEEDILIGQQLLARRGFYVEPTSALVAAGLNQLASVIEENHIVVLPLTGSGLKGAPQHQIRS